MATYKQLIELNRKRKENTANEISNNEALSESGSASIENTSNSSSRFNTLLSQSRALRNKERETEQAENAESNNARLNAWFSDAQKAFGSADSYLSNTTYSDMLNKSDTVTKALNSINTQSVWVEQYLKKYEGTEDGEPLVNAFKEYKNILNNYQSKANLQQEYAESFNDENEYNNALREAKYANYSYDDLQNELNNFDENSEDYKWLTKKSNEVASSEESLKELEPLQEELDSLEAEYKELLKSSEENHTPSEREKINERLDYIEKTRPTLQKEVENKKRQVNAKTSEEQDNQYNNAMLEKYGDYSYEQLFAEAKKFDDNSNESNWLKNAGYEKASSEDLQSEYDKLTDEYNSLYDNRDEEENYNRLKEIEQSKGEFENQISKKKQEERVAEFNNLDEETRNIISAKGNINYWSPTNWFGGDEDTKKAEENFNDLDMSKEDKNKYLETYNRMVESYNAELQHKVVQEQAESNPALASIISIGNNTIGSIPDAFKYIGANIDKANGGDGYVNPRATNVSKAQTARETVSKDMNGIGSFLYNAGMSMADFTVLLPLNLVPGGQAGSLAVMGTSAGVSSANTVIENGGDLNSAISTGLAAGIAEAFFEKFSLGELKALKVKGTDSIKKAIFKNALVEGSEEVGTDIANAITDQIINGDMSQLSQQYQNYIKQGYTEDEAWKMCAVDFGAQVGQSFAGGAISGGVLGGGAIGLNYATNKIENSKSVVNNKVGKAVKENENVNSLIETAKKLSTESKAYKVAVQLEEQQKNNKKVSSSKVGQLCSLIIEQSQSEFDTEYKKVTENLHEDEKAVVDKLLNREALSEDEVKILNDNDVLKNSIADVQKKFNNLYSSTETANKAPFKSIKSIDDNTDKIDESKLKVSEDGKTKVNDEVYDGAMEVVRTNPFAETVTYKMEQNGEVVEVNSENIEFRAKEEAKLNALASKYDVQTAQKFFDLYESGQDVDEYSREFNIYQNYGRLAVPLDSEKLNVGYLLDNDQKRGAYEAGLTSRRSYYQEQNILSSNAKNSKYYAYTKGNFNASAIKGIQLDETQRAFYNFFREFALRTGLNVELFSSKEKSGKYQGEQGSWDKNAKTIRVDINAGLMSVKDRAEIKHGMFNTFSHELTHIAELSGFYDELHEAIVSALEKRGTDFNELVKAKKDELINSTPNAKTMSDEKLTYLADVEVIANNCETMLKNSKIFEDIAQGNPTLAQKIKDKLKNFIARLKQLLNKTNALTHEGKLLEECVTEFENINRIWDKAVTDGIKTANAMHAEQKNNTADNSDVKNQSRNIVQSEFEKNVDAIEKNTYNSNNIVIMGVTPDVLQKIGLTPLPLAMTKNHIYSIAVSEARAKKEGRYRKNTNYHALGFNTVKDIYDKISNPLMVIAHPDFTNKVSRDSTHKVIVLVDLSVNGEQIIAPIEMDFNAKYNNNFIDVNLVSTYFNKKNIGDLIKEAVALETNNRTGFFYVDKKRTQSIFEKSGYQLPRILNNSSSNIIIRKIDDNVNKKINKITQSQQFIRWFGDWQNHPESASKVVDKNGEPLVVYHGTLTQGIHEFKKEYIGSRYSFDEVGFFFTDRKSIAEDYASSEFGSTKKGDVIPVYLNMRNPLYFDKSYAIKNGYGNVFRENDSIGVWDAYQGAILDEVAEKSRCDGVIIDDGTSKMLVVFEPNQIKSATDNIGTFDGNNPDIRYQSRNTGIDEDIEELLFDEEFYKPFENEDKTVITESLSELQTKLENMNDDNSTWEEEFEIRTKIKALKEGYKSPYDYFVGKQKKNILKDYEYDPEKYKEKFKKKLEKKAKEESLKNDIANTTPHKRAQYYIIQKTNPMWDDYHLGIRSPKDIKTFQEVIDEGEGFEWGDFDLDDAKKALKKGTIKVYSSYAIKNGTFVSTSYQQALEYAGMNPQNVHSRVVALDSVAWINGDEGQYAKVYKSDLDDNIQYQQRYVEPASTALEERLQGDELLDAQDIIDTIKSVGGKVDEYGNAILYHGTNKNSRDLIYQSGKMIAKEDGLFFSTKPDGEIKYYGDNIVRVKIPVEYLELNDIFNDEAHFRLPLNSDYSANVSSVLFQMRPNDDYFFDDLFDDDGIVEQSIFEKAVKDNPDNALMAVYQHAAITAQTAITQSNDVRLDEKAYLRVARKIMQEYDISRKLNKDFDTVLAEKIRMHIGRIENGVADFESELDSIVKDCQEALLFSGHLDYESKQDERDFVFGLINGKRLLVTKNGESVIKEEYGSIRNYQRKMFGHMYVTLESNLHKKKDFSKDGLYISDIIASVKEQYENLLHIDENADDDVGYLWLDNLVNNYLEPQLVNHYIDGYYENLDTAALEVAFDITTEIINAKASQAVSSSKPNHRRIRQLANAKKQANSEQKAVQSAKLESYKKQLNGSEVSDSNRHILADLLTDSAQNEEESNIITSYKSEIDTLDTLEEKLYEINKKIKEISFKKGSDRSQIANLKEQQKNLKNKIERKDKQLLKLESMDIMKKLINSEKQKASAKSAEKVRSEYQQKLKDEREKHNAELASVKERDRERIAEVRESKDKIIVAEREKRKTMVKGVREARDKKEIIRKIKKKLKDIDKLLNRSKADKTVKQGLRDTASKLISLSDVLLDTNLSNADIVRRGIEIATPDEQKLLKEYLSIIGETDTELSEAQRRKVYQLNSKLKDLFIRERERLNRATVKQALTELSETYKSVENAPEAYLRNSFDKNIIEAIDNFKEEIGGTLVKDMNVEQVQKLHDIVTMILTSIRNANKLFAEDTKLTCEETSNNVMNEILSVKGTKEIRNLLANKILDFQWRNLKPIYAFRLMGSKTFEKIYWNLQKGELDWYIDLAEAKQFKEECEEKYGYKSFDFKKTFEFTAIDGSTFTLDLNQMMDIYAASRRPQALQHLLKGGFTFEKDSADGKLKVKTGAKAYPLTMSTIQSIANGLSENEKGYAEAMQKYLSEVMAKKGNKVSMALYGVEMFNEDTYWSISSSDTFLKVEENETTGEFKVKNSGFTKSTIRNASNPIVLRGFEENWCNHVNQMSLYHAMTLPLEDFTKVFNYNTGVRTSEENPTAVTGVRSVIKGAFGNSAERYLRQFISDLNGGIREASRVGIADNMIALSKKAAVFANFSVFLQQPSAIFRAMSYVNANFFLPEPNKLVRLQNHRKDWEQLKKYAPIAGIKEMGMFDTGTGKGVLEWLSSGKRDSVVKKTQNKIDDVGSWLPAKADEYAWVKLWHAIQRETRARYGLAIGTEENLVKSGERFNEVVHLTQVYDSVFSRSGAMRSSQTFDKMATSFMAEPTTIMNMAVDAVVQLKRNGKSGIKQFAKSASAILISIFANTLLKSVITAGRDDDEDETYGDKYLQAFYTDLINSAIPLNYYPIMRDLVSVIEGYTTERMDMSLVSDFIVSLKKLTKEDGATANNIIDFVGYIANLFGLPVRNVVRDFRAAFNTYNTLTTTSKDPITSLEMSMPTDYQEAYDKYWQEGYEEKDCESKAAMSVKSKIRKKLRPVYLEALKNQDSATVANIRRYMRDSDFYNSLNGVDEVLKGWRKNSEEEEERAQRAEERKNK